jgi:CBS domain containing-hemolysin-like protein
MESQLLLLFLFATLAILVSFLCSMWESVLLSITPSYAMAQEQKGSAIGRRLSQFKENIDRPLAAILTLNTIAHTVGAIGVGQQASQIWQASNPMITGVAVPVLMTLGILVLSEIIPKTLGANYWKELAPFTVYSLVILLKLLAPLVWMTELITRALRRDATGPIFSRRELTAMAEVGAREGVIEQHESAFISNLMGYQAIQARDIMTPRTVTVMASSAVTFADFQQQLAEMRFSRIPLFDPEQPGLISGYVLRTEALQCIAEGKGQETLASIRRDILVVMEGDPIGQLFRTFLERREHIAVVVDDYGEIRGVVSLEDVIETMLGLEIVDELDHAEDMQALARESWKQRARARGIPVDDQDSAD